MLPRHPGIYKIVCSANDKIYVGMSLDILKRRNQHFSLLRKGKHYNRYLQSAYNKHGKDSFRVIVIELTDAQNLEDREQYWITKLKASDRRIGYNASETANPGHCENFTKPKNYIVTLPYGAELKVKNLTKFCRDLGWTHPDSRLHRVANGQANSYRGYVCRYADQTKQEWLLSRKRYNKPGVQIQFYIEVTHPGGRKELVKDFTKFCKDNGLSRGSAWSCMTRPDVRTQHKGFTFKKQLI